MTIRTALGELALRIDHSGSTSVPGLAAKDVIDVQVTLKDFTCTPQIVTAFGSPGYTQGQEVTSDHVPPLSQGSAADWEKRSFRQPVGLRRMHLHVRALGRPNQRYPLLFRDYLRTHPVVSAAYAQIKTSLSKLHPDDVDFYYAIKDPLCDIVIDAAEEWAQVTGWHMGPSDI